MRLTNDVLPLTREVLPPRQAPADLNDVLKADLREREAVARSRAFWATLVLASAVGAVTHLAMVWP